MFMRRLFRHKSLPVGKAGSPGLHEKLMLRQRNVGLLSELPLPTDPEYADLLEFASAISRFVEADVVETIPDGATEIKGIKLRPSPRISEIINRELVLHARCPLIRDTAAIRELSLESRPDGKNLLEKR